MQQITKQASRFPNKISNAHEQTYADQAAQLTALLGDLIAIPSVSGDREQNHAVLAYVAAYLHKRGLHVQWLEWNDVESIYASVQPGNKTPRVLLAGHTDVIVADKSMYELREDDEKFYGRGVFDMKFAIAAYLQTVDMLHQQGTLEQYDMGILLTSDEEVGGFNGVKQTVDAGYLPGVVVLPDSGNNWQVEAFAKGDWHALIATSGVSAHGSRPWEGDNAIDSLMQVLAEIKKLFPNDDKNASTLSVGTIEGGKATNQVPDSARATIDLRTASKADDKRLRTAVERICAKHGATVTTTMHLLPIEHDLNDPFVKAFRDSIKDVTGAEAGAWTSYGASDARWFDVKGIPTILTSPSGGNHHGPGEWIDKAGLFQLPAVLINYLDRTAK